MATQKSRVDDLEDRVAPADPVRMILVWGGGPDTTPAHLVKGGPGDRVIRLMWPDDDNTPADEN